MKKSLAVVLYSEPVLIRPAPRHGVSDSGTLRLPDGWAELLTGPEQIEALKDRGVGTRAACSVPAARAMKLPRPAHAVRS